MNSSHMAVIYCLRIEECGHLDAVQDCSSQFWMLQRDDSARQRRCDKTPNFPFGID